MSYWNVIDRAKEALIFFLKSLPGNSKFNIYSFGSKFYKIFDHPVDYNEQNLEQTV